MLSCVQLFATLCTVASVHGISQARTLEWVAISFSRRSSWPRYQTHVSCVSCIAGGFFTTCVTGELISYICPLFELVCIGRTDAEAETPILWPPHVKSWLIGKDHDAGRGWGQEEKGTTEDEMAGWYPRLEAHAFGWTPGVGLWTGRPGMLQFMGSKESDMTEWLNWTELKY